MELHVLRYNSESDYTDGLFFVGNKFECFTLEDEERTVKVYGETCIPDGRYKVELRTEGGFHQRYLKKFGESFHKGMLWIKDVPNFKFVLIHIGNTDEDTAACLLRGSTADKDRGYIGASKNAYVDLYPKIANAILEGEDVYINYKTIKDVENQICAL